MLTAIPDLSCLSSAVCSNLEASTCTEKSVDPDQTANEAVSDLGP